MAKIDNSLLTESSGNVFVDLGLPNAVERDTKMRLGVAIHRTVQRRKLSQAAVAQILGVNQPKVSALMNYKLDGFSVERLIRFLIALGQDVDISVKSKPPSRAARIAVKAA